jgi:hypothetical protein
MKVRLIAVLIVVALPLLGSATDSYINTASIFELWCSARALGMGGAFIALANDEAAVYYNPAGLASISTHAFSSLYTRPFGAYSFGVLGLAGQGWGAELLILDSDTLEERDLYGNLIGSFRFTEAGLILGTGFTLGNHLAFGMQAKLYSLVFPDNGFGLALSPSILYTQGALSYGIVWRNLISTDIHYSNGHTEPWIRDIAVGISWHEEDRVICVDFTEHLITRGDIRCVRLGAEYTRFWPVVLRAGVNREGSTFGLSVYWENMHIDFACLLHKDLPPSYLLAFSYRWQGSLLQPLKGFFRR